MKKFLIFFPKNTTQNFFFFNVFSEKVFPHFRMADDQGEKEKNALYSWVPAD